MKKYTQFDMPHSHLVNCGDYDYAVWMHMICWMEQHFGASRKTWQCEHVHGAWVKVRFVHECDYMLWRLSWS